MRTLVTIALLLAILPGTTRAQNASRVGHEITVSGTRFMLDGKPFPYTGVSFFNAIYNPTFNRSSEERVRWLEKFQRYGINVLRVWGQWDNKRGFVDACSTCSLVIRTDGSGWNTCRGSRRSRGMPTGRGR
jgi:hypothetical protein